MAEEQSSGCSPESCSSCAHAGSCSSAKKDLKAPANPYSQVKKVIGVVSGKGGVGKSMVTASLARMMVQQGYAVGILDADITGPSIPKMYGVHGSAVGSEAGMFPCVAKDGTKIMSVNLLLEHESDPVIWRGPVIAGVVTQFWTDVMWGDLDFLFVDMPPGTGDVPLTVFQSLPVDGVVIVTSPQDLVQMIVEKAYNMAKKMNIPVLGKLRIDRHLSEYFYPKFFCNLVNVAFPKYRYLLSTVRAFQITVVFHQSENRYLKNIIDKFN